MPIIKCFLLGRLSVLKSRPLLFYCSNKYGCLSELDRNCDKVQVILKTLQKLSVALQSSPHPAILSEH